MAAKRAKISKPKSFFEKHGITLGPDGMPEGMPADYGIATLGDELCLWAEDQLLTPDGPDAGTPLRLKRWQAKFFCWLYAVDSKGKWLFSRGQLVLVKGAGKSPTAAIWAVMELAGPSVFSHFTKAKNPVAVGKRHPQAHVGIAAVSEAQTRNTFDLIEPMIEGSPLALELEGLEMGATRVRFRATSGWAKIVLLSSGSKSLQGVRLTACVMDETQHWTQSQGGITLKNMIMGNLGKTGGRPLETTNAFLPGEDSVAESTNAQVLNERAGRKRGNRVILQYWRSAPADLELGDEDALRAELEKLYDEAPWVDLDTIIETIYSTDYGVNEARRMYLNQLVQMEMALVNPQVWDRHGGAKPLQPGEEIVLGFDGSLGDDFTALVACRIVDRSYHLIGAWQAGKRDKNAFRSEVAGVVESTFETYKVLAGAFDSALWESHIATWEEKYGKDLHVEASRFGKLSWDSREQTINKETARRNEGFLAALEAGDITHDGDATLRQHALQACGRWVGKYRGFGKEYRGSPKKIDGYAALIHAEIARALLQEKGKAPKKKGGQAAWG